MRMNRHLFEGFKYAVFVIVLYSISLALSTLWILPEAIPNAIYWCIIPVLTAAIANSITAKIVILPGVILGIFFTFSGLGFFGGIIGGLLLGGIAYLLCLKLSFEHPIWSVVIGYLVIAGFSFGMTYLLMEYLIGPPIIHALDWIRDQINTIPSTQVLLLVGILSFLTVVDLGGPFNKLAYSFILSFYIDGFYHITGPIIISVALPPMMIVIALKLFPQRFDTDDHSSLKFALFGALFGMTEGALPIAMKRPLKIVPALLIGSVSASILAAYFELENILLIPSIGGLFGTSHILYYVLCHIVGLVIGVSLIVVSSTKQLLHNDEVSV